ncbi:MAG: pantoate--beta-alanine ligase [Alphaproteobacteria bacterium]|jgi:pantoate--beta-alanine ligase|nr:pantoate--beta-alanine ligase [Alphaproteobacteria bacterium]MBT7942593.1 pantoate--beta-alanine ligase [Alphaproteobacteria bacterium]
MLKTVHTIEDLRAEIRAWRQAGETVGLVPTMGALHDGHLSLVRVARAKCMRTCATLFVNPKQFGPSEDLDTYPRNEAGDADRLAAEGVDLLFQPGPDEVYPPGFTTTVHVEGLGDILEGEHRPGFFTGVATVVTKLLLQSLPDVAVFGEKDYQQVLVIRRLARDLDIPVRIEGAPIVRESDGLAMSSRNAYLNADERAIATALFGTISQIAENVGRGAAPVEQADWGADQLLRAGFATVDYLTVRDAETLVAVDDASRPARVLAAAKLGQTRLIDNVAV